MINIVWTGAFAQHQAQIWINVGTLWILQTWHLEYVFATDNDENNIQNYLAH